MDALIGPLQLAIQEKNQIAGLKESFVKERIKAYLTTYGSIRKQLEDIDPQLLTKNKLFKQTVKDIREEIGVVYGAFLTQKFKKKEKLLEKIYSIEAIEELLPLHKSTRERIDEYTTIYKKIFAWYQPTRIADLGCGLNPLSLLNYQIELVCGDLNKEDMDFLNLVFRKFHITANAKQLDLTDPTVLEDVSVQSADLVFLFKTIDSIETLKRNYSRELIKGLHAKHLVVSFPTASLVAHQTFKKERTAWFIKFMNQEGYECEKFETQNELFYLITKP